MKIGLTPDMDNAITRLHQFCLQEKFGYRLEKSKTSGLFALCLNREGLTVALANSTSFDEAVDKVIAQVREQLRQDVPTFRTKEELMP